MNGYYTILKPDGLTTIICDTCKASAPAGVRFIHRQGCEKAAETVPRRRFKEIQRVITYPIAAEVGENGALIIP